jgi:hypothetical protein
MTSGVMDRNSSCINALTAPSVCVLLVSAAKQATQMLKSVDIGTKARIRGPLEKFMDWRQCAAVMQKEAVTVMPSCSGGGNVVVV